MPQVRGGQTFWNYLQKQMLWVPASRIVRLFCLVWSSFIMQFV